MNILNAEHISMGFADKQVLNNLNIAISHGKIVTILGPNGCGKSTLLKILSRHITPTSGAVYLDGKCLNQYSYKEIAREMAVLPQTPQSPSDLTVKDLVEYGRFPHQSWFQAKAKSDDDYVEWALKETGLSSMAARLVSTLSGGERQRVWIAMALAQKPKVLLLDEPTTYLDICHQLEIMELLARLNEELNITVVMVLHDINHAARYSNEVMVIKQGAVFATGTPNEVITQHTLREVFRVESTIEYELDKPVVTIRGLVKKT